MPLAGTDFGFYKASTMGTSLTSPSNVGGAISATLITGGSLSEVFFMMASSGSVQTQFEKTFLQNDHASLSGTTIVCWLNNALDDVASNGVPACVSSSASDSSSYYIRFLGADASSVAQQEQVTMNGTSQQAGVLTFSRLDRAEKRAVSGDTLTAAVGDITIKVNAVTLGVIPAPDNEFSWYSATAEVKIGLEASLGGSTTTTNAGTAPGGGVSFTKPRTQATGISFASSGTLAPTEAQAIWWKWELPANAKPSADIDNGIKFFVAST